MSLYTSQTLISPGHISPENLVALTDDQGSGQVNQATLTSAMVSASSLVDGLLCATYVVPFVNPPTIVQEAATIFACEILMRRRLVQGETNPFTADAHTWRDTLKAICQKGGGLDSATTRAYPPGYVQQIPSRINSSCL
jgi:phage gp36-like protein